jgi:hypothetical protein
VAAAAAAAYQSPHQLKSRLHVLNSREQQLVAKKNTEIAPHQLWNVLHVNLMQRATTGSKETQN